MAKITLATLKSFVKKNEGKLFVSVSSRFDSMSDGVRSVVGNFAPAQKADRVWSNNLGYADIWLVGGSRDFFKAYDDGEFIGFLVYNCCGSFTVAVKK